MISDDGLDSDVDPEVGVDVDLDVALVAPPGAPGVLKDPGILGVADNDHSVVDGSSVNVCEDTAAVGHEARGVGVEGSGDWALLQGSLDVLSRLVVDVAPKWPVVDVLSISWNVASAGVVVSTRKVRVV